MSSFLPWWVNQARRLAWAVVIAAALATAGAAYYGASHLRLITDTDALLSAELPYRKIYADFDKAFPQLGDNIAIVVDGKTPDQAQDRATALAKRLRARSDLFKQVFFPQGDPFFRRNELLFLSVTELQGLTDRLADAQPLISTLAEDMSLRGLFDVLGLAADDVVKGDTKPAPLVRVFRLVSETVEANLESRSAGLSWRELMEPEPPDPSDYRQFITVQPNPDYSTLAPAKTAIQAIRQTAADLNLDKAHGVRVRLTGGVPIREDELKSVRDSVGLAGIISLALVSLLVFIGLRSPKLVFGTVVSLLMGLAWTAAFAALAIGHLNLISVAFAVMFIGLAVDFSIQFGLRYKEGINVGVGHQVSLRHAATGTGPAVCLAALCAMIGFFAFVPTAYLGLSELGMIAGVGMLIGLFCALTVLPAILTLRPPRPEARRPQQTGPVAFGTFVERRAGAICVAALAVGLASFAALPEARFDFDPIDLRDPNTESVQTYLDLAKDSSTSPYSINIMAPDLDAAVKLRQGLEKLDVVENTVTLRSFVPDNQEEKLNIIDNMALFLTPILEFGKRKQPPTVAERRTATTEFLTKVKALATSPNAGPLSEPARRLADHLFRFVKGPGQTPGPYAELENSLLTNLPGRLRDLRNAMSASPVTLENLPRNLRTRYVTADGRARVEVFPAERLTNREALRRFVSSVQSIAPNATDTPVILLKGSDTVIAAFKEAGALALVTISILLIVVLRSFADSVLVLSPLVLAVLLTVAVMVLSGMPFNFANIIALPLLFTLGVAFGIYLVLRYRQVGSVADLLRTSTPRAVLFSALTTMAAFGSLMVSSHRGTASMGQLLAICLALAVASTLVVLPALLAWRANRRARGTER